MNLETQKGQWFWNSLPSHWTLLNLHIIFICWIYIYYMNSCRLLNGNHSLFEVFQNNCLYSFFVKFFNQHSVQLLTICDSYFIVWFCLCCHFLSCAFALTLNNHEMLYIVTFRTKKIFVFQYAQLHIAID